MARALKAFQALKARATPRLTPFTDTMPAVEKSRSPPEERGSSADVRNAAPEQNPRAAERAERDPDAKLQKAARGAKHLKAALDAAAGEWVCPITRELPLDPVVAEDGYVYERADIERWLEEHRRSPRTGAAMGARLVPSPQARNSIKHLVRSGAVGADKSGVWTAKLKNERLVKKLRAKADQGDADAMCYLGYLYNNGKRGLTEDKARARILYARAAELGHVEGMACYGMFLLSGFGGPSVPGVGLVYIGRAIERGSKMAHLVLGTAFAEGVYGLPQDSVQAVRHLRYAAEGKVERRVAKTECERAVAEIIGVACYRHLSVLFGT